MALFTTTDELKQFYPARVTFDIADLLPTIKAVEREYLRDQVLGEGQLNELQEAYTADTLTAAQEELLEMVRTAVANLAIYQYTGFGNVELSASGLVAGQTEHKRPAAEWRTRDLERAALRAGYRGLDDTLGYLQAHRSDFPTWVSSEQCTALDTGWLRSTRDFGRFVQIGNSGYLYTRMLPVVRRIESEVVAKTICSEDLRTDLLEKLTDGTLDATEKQLVHLAQMATAHLTMADCVVELSLGMDDRGVWTWNSLLGGSTSGGPMAASDERLNQRITHHQNLGNGALKKLQEQLQALAEADENHPYRASACYVAPTEEPKNRYNTDSPVGGFMA